MFPFPNSLRDSGPPGAFNPSGDDKLCLFKKRCFDAA